MPYIIAGLGNPGEEYEGTRHNARRIILEAVHKAHDFSEWKHDKKLNALVAKGEIAGETVKLIEPETFMNRSGGAIKPLVANEKAAAKLVVVYDDLDLGIGTMKISFDRGDGGHKGLESITKALKTRKFPRIRIGIAPVTPSGKLRKPSGEDAVQKHILGQFKKAELDILKKQGKEISHVLATLIENGLQAAMMELNSK